LLHDVRSKEAEYFNEEVAGKFQTYCKRLKMLVLEQRNATSLAVYIESIPTMCTQFESVCHTAI